LLLILADILGQDTVRLSWWMGWSLTLKAGAQEGCAGVWTDPRPAPGLGKVPCQLSVLKGLVTQLRRDRRLLAPRRSPTRCRSLVVSHTCQKNFSQKP